MTEGSLDNDAALEPAEKLESRISTPELETRRVPQVSLLNSISKLSPAEPSLRDSLASVSPSVLPVAPWWHPKKVFSVGVSLRRSQRGRLRPFVIIHS
jgi:hypothetical protein